MLGCSRTKDNFFSRTFHNTTSTYNILFNGEQALLAGQQKLESAHQDNFEEILRVYKIGNEANATAAKPDMDRAIEKGTKVIQQHSMMIRNDQKNNYVDDSYLLIGKARYYNRDFLPALETFNYVIQQFPKDEIAVTARLWAAKTEAELGNYLPAKTKFDEVYRDKKLDKKIKADAFASYAQLEIDYGSKSAAYQLLSQAVDKSKTKKDKVRWMFIMAQLQERLGNDFEASQWYRKVIKKGPPYELLFQAQLSRARSFDVDLQDADDVFKDLRKMLKDDKNYDNRDQILYVMAEVAEKLDDDALEEKYLKESVRKSTTNATQKGLSYLELADDNFDNKLYKDAAAYYDSASSNLPERHPKYAAAKIRKESLADLVKHLTTIELQDSLQALAGLSDKQLEKKIDAILRKENEAAEAERRRQQALEFDQQFANTGGDDVGGDNLSASAGGQWYFYNQSLRASGITNFRNRFGNRKLEDNWRRKDKQVSEDFSNFDEDGEETPDGDLEARAEGEDSEVAGDNPREKYLAAVPKTEEEMAASHAKIQAAFLAIGTIYKNDLEDYESAERNLEELLKRYPDFEERAKVWYTLYRVNILDEDQPDADKYKKLILDNFPNSDFAALVQGKQPASLEKDAVATNYYNKTYRAYNQGIYKKSLTMADSGLTAYAGSSRAPQFMLLKAFSLEKTGQRPVMKQTLTDLVQQFPNTEQSRTAQALLQKMEPPKEEPTAAEGGDKNGEAGKPAAAGKYKIDGRGAWQYIASVPNVKGLVNNIVIGLTDFNAKYFKNQKLKVKSVYISPKEQMVMVTGLPNQNEALKYYRIVAQQKVLENELNGLESKNFVISAANFQAFYKDKDFEGYEGFFEEEVLK